MCRIKKKKKTNEKDDFNHISMQQFRKLGMHKDNNYNNYYMRNPIENVLN